MLVAGTATIADGGAERVAGAAAPDCTNWRYGPADEPPAGSLPTELDRNSYKTIDRPLLCLSGTKDVQKGKDAGRQPPSVRLQAFKLMPPGDKYLAWLDNAGHMGFSYNPKARDLIGSEAREDMQRIAKALAVVFCNAYLKADRRAKAHLNAQYAGSLCGKVVTKVAWYQK